MRRFEFREGTSAKFWEVEVEGAAMTVRFGRLGTDGQSQVKKFGSPEDASAAAEKGVREKTGKGYREVGGRKDAKPEASKPKAPAAKKGSGVARAAVRQRVQETHGLTLPDSFFDFVDFWGSRSTSERRVLDRLGISLYGVADLCEKGGLELVASPGTEALLHGRYFLDPPEFLTVLSGDSDGLHYGLWFDDPAQPPAFVASYYSRDDPSLHFAGVDLFDVLRRNLEPYTEEDDDDADALNSLIASLPAPSSPKTPPPYDGARAEVGDLRLWVPKGPAKRHRLDSDDPSALLPRVVAALAEAPTKDPAKLEKTFALAASAYRACSRDDEELSNKAGELLERVYRALGREALARIVKVHRENRLLASVSVLVSKREAARDAKRLRAEAKADAIAPSRLAARKVEVQATTFSLDRRTASLALSPDGRTLALGYRRPASEAGKPTLSLHDVTRPAPGERNFQRAFPATKVLLKPKNGWVARVHLLPDGRVLYWRVAPKQDENVWHGHLTVSRANGKDLAETNRLKGSASTRTQVSPDGRYLLLEDVDTLALYEVPPIGKKWGKPRALKGEAGTFLGDGRIALHRPIGDPKKENAELVICSPDGSKEEKKLRWNRYSLFGGGTFVLELATIDRSAEVIDVSTGKVKKLAFHQRFQGGAVTPDGRLAAYLGDRGDFALCDPESGALLWKKKKLLGDALLDEPVAIDSAGTTVAVMVPRAEQAALLRIS